MAIPRKRLAGIREQVDARDDHHPPRVKIFDNTELRRVKKSRTACHLEGVYIRALSALYGDLSKNIERSQLLNQAIGVTTFLTKDYS